MRVRIPLDERVGASPEAPTPPPPSGRENMGTINLSKGQAAVSLTKTASLQVHASWPAKTDYDLYALIVNRDGTVEHVANFGATGVPPLAAYKGVSISADAGRGGGGTSTETLTVNLDCSIA